jgi:hypothetical protein
MDLGGREPPVPKYPSNDLISSSQESCNDANIYGAYRHETTNVYISHLTYYDDSNRDISISAACSIFQIRLSINSAISKEVLTTQ